MFAEDFGHLCRGIRIHTSGHSDSRILSNLGASSNFYLSVGRYCIRCLSVAIWQLGRRRTLISTNCADSRVLVLQCLSGARLCLCTSLIWVPTPRSWVSISVAKWTFFLSLCVSRITSFLLLTCLFQIPYWDCLEFFPFLVHGSCCIRNFHCLWHRNKLVR